MAIPFAQIGSSLLQGGLSLLGGMQDNKAAAKAALNSHIFQQELNQQAQGFQVDLADKQNAMISGINSRIEAHNAEERRMAFATAGTPTVNTTSQSSFGSIDFAALVRDSEAAGFNPLTVLRAGGMAGYSTSNTLNINTVSGGAYQPSYMTFMGYGEIPQGPAPGQAAQQTVVPAFSNAVSAGLNAWNSYDPNKEERQQLEMGIARAQIANLNSDTAGNNYRLTIPTWTGTGFTNTTGGFGGAVRSIASGGSSGGLGQPAKWEEGAVKVTNPMPFGMIVDPRFADAEAVETRHGEVTANIYGGGVAVADLKANIYADPIKYLKMLPATQQLIKSYDAAKKVWDAAPSKEAQRNIVMQRLGANLRSVGFGG